MSVSAGQVVVSIAAESSAYQQEMTKVQTIASKTSKSVQDAFSKTTGVPSTVTQSVASLRAEAKEAQGTMALLGDEIGVTIPRHLRTFLNQLPGVQSAMATAFNAIAIVGVINVLVEVGKKVAEFYEAVKKTVEAPKAIQQAFNGVNSSLQTSNDEVQKQNDVLANTIAKLTGKPQNNLKIALDDAAISAEKLSKALGDDIKQEIQALSQNGIGRVMGFVIGKATTADIGDALTAYQGRIQGLASDGDDAIHRARQVDIQRGDGKSTATDKAVSDKNIALVNQYNVALKDLNTRLSDAKKLADESGDKQAEIYTARITALQGAINGLSLQKSSVQLTQDNSSLSAQANKLQGDKEAGAQADKIKEAQEKLAEAQRQAAAQNAAIMQQNAQAAAQAQLSVLENMHAQGLVSDRQYYAQKQALQQQEIDAERTKLQSQADSMGKLIAQTQGQHFTDRAKQIDNEAKLTEQLAKQAELTAQITQLDQRDTQQKESLATAALEAAKADEQRLAAMRAQLERSSGFNSTAQIMASRQQFNDNTLPALQKSGASAQDIAAAQELQSQVEARIALESQENQLTVTMAKYRQAELQIETAMATGTMTRVAGEQQLAALYQAQLASAQELGPALNQSASQAGQAGVQAMQKFAEELDKLQQKALDPNTLLAGGNAQTGFQLWAQQIVNQGKSAAQQVHDDLTDALNQVNDQLSSLITGGKTDFAKMFENIGKDFVSNGLKSLESNAMKALGLGSKADGSANNPYHVIIAGGIGSGNPLGGDSDGSDPIFGDMSDSGSDGGDPIFGGLTGMLSKTVSGMGGGIGSLFSGLFSSSGGASDSGDLLSSIFSSGGIGGGAGDLSDLSSMFGGLLANGDPGLDPSKFYIAGEAGPEIVSGSSAKRVFSNKDSAAMFGGGGGQHIYVQAGVERQEVQSAVKRGMQKSYQSSVPGAVRAQTEHNQRIPRMARQ